MNSGRSIYFRWIILGGILLFVIMVRLRLGDIPLERDEGEYAYMGQLMLQGVPLYSEAYTMKLPGTAMMYALIMALFGQTVRGIHLGLLMINCATIVLLFLLCKKIANDAAGLAAGAAYAVLSLSPSLLGFAAHATHFVVLPALAGTLVLQSAKNKDGRWPLFWSGMLFGLAAVMKQPGSFFFLFGASCVVSDYAAERRAGNLRKLASALSVFALAGMVPLLAVLIWTASTGTFGTFWFWTVEYASRYGSQVPLAGVIPAFRKGIAETTESFVLLWVLACFGFCTLFLDRAMKERRSFLVRFSFFSFLTILPGFFFRSHYFITLLPALSLSLAVGIEYLNTKGKAFSTAGYARHLGTGLFLCILLYGINAERGYLFTHDPVRISRDIYTANPFPESREVARMIAENTSPSDRIAVFGSEPQIYFYSRRRAATGFLYTYSLMELHDLALEMQKEMADEIEASHPKVIVDVNVETSWVPRRQSELSIFSWFDDLISRHYRLVGIVDIISPETTVYTWGKDVEEYSVQSSFFLLVYERIESGGTRIQ